MTDGAHRRLECPEEWEFVESGGVGPFEDSEAVYRLPDGSEYRWESRRHRKGRGPRKASGSAAATSDASPESKSGNPWLEFYAPHRISWWISVTFIAGSAMFTLGAGGALAGETFASWGSSVSEVPYFVGALFFTVGIYLQLLEGLNASGYVGLERPYNPRSFTWFAWRPRRLEFAAPFTLLIGSLLFNVETTLALFGVSLESLIGGLSLSGALLFVVSTYLQLIEVCHRYVCVRPREISWWVALFNLVGSVGFLAGSTFDFRVGLPSVEASMLTTIGFLAGSALFLAGSYLLLPEMFSE